MVSDAYNKAREILNKYRKQLDLVAQKLLESETLSKEEFEAIFPAPVPHKSGTPVYMEK
jgi:cell division protease FtsH